MSNKKLPQKTSKDAPSTGSPKKPVSPTREQKAYVMLLSDMLMAWVAFGVFMLLFVGTFIAFMASIFYYHSDWQTKLIIGGFNTFLGVANRKIWNYLFGGKRQGVGR
jgi:hypothetical protein